MRPLLVATALVGIGLAGTANARRLEIWSYQRLLKESDLVVIGRAISESPTEDRTTDNPWKAEFEGLDTKFRVALVLKDKGKKKKELTVLHFRVKDGGRLEDGPLHVTFQSKPLKLNLTDNRDNAKMNVQMAVPEYLLFLKRRDDGRYEPVSGRVDPELSVRELHSQNLSWLDSLGER